MFTPVEAIQAIKNLIKGELTHHEILKMRKAPEGDLAKDVLYILELTFINREPTPEEFKEAHPEYTKKIDKFVNDLNGVLSQYICDHMLKLVLDREYRRKLKFILDNNKPSPHLFYLAASEAAETIFKSFLQYGCNAEIDGDRMARNFAELFK